MAAEPPRFITHAAQDAQSLLDVVLAIALSRGERALAVDNGDVRGGVLKAHVALIRETGIHEFSEEEKRLIAERTPRRWDRDAAEADDEIDGDSSVIEGEVIDGEVSDEGAA